MAGWAGLEPATFCVTGRRSNQLSYHPVFGERVRTVGCDFSKSSVLSAVFFTLIFNLNSTSSLL